MEDNVLCYRKINNMRTR
ncbi:hypothetical protein EC940618_4122, partial [Escherichia coli 94.0618]